MLWQMLVPLYRQAGAAAVPTVPLLDAAVGLVVACAAWELYLLLRQRRMYALRKIPEPITVALASLSAAGPQGAKLAAGLDARFEQSQRYGLAKSSVGLAEHAQGFVVALATLLGGVLPALFDTAHSIVSAVSPGLDSTETVTSIVFIWLVLFAARVVGLPLSLYRTFVLEASFGFNKQSLKSFAYDETISGALSTIIAVPVVAVLVALFKWTGGTSVFFLWAWGFASVLIVSLVLLYPVAIAPLFNRFSTLSAGSSLRARIIDLARSQKFPLSKVLVMDGSARSAHSNAYFIGLCGAKQIVLFDTLIAQLSEDEICAVLCHEMGHWAEGDTYSGLARALVVLAAALGGFARLFDWAPLYDAAGVTRGDTGSRPPIFLGLMIFNILVMDPLGPLCMFAFSAISRRQEYRADAYAVRLGHAVPLQNALVALHVENLSSFAVDPLFSAYHYSHPPLAERLAAIHRLAPSPATVPLSRDTGSDSATSSNLPAMSTDDEVIATSSSPRNTRARASRSHALRRSLRHAPSPAPFLSRQEVPMFLGLKPQPLPPHRRHGSVHRA